MIGRILRRLARRFILHEILDLQISRDSARRDAYELQFRLKEQRKLSISLQSELNALKRVNDAQADRIDAMRHAAQVPVIVPE